MASARVGNTSRAKKNGPPKRAKDARERIRSSLPLLLLVRTIPFGEALVWQAVQPANFCFTDDYMTDFNAARRRIAIKPTSPSPASIMA